MDTQKLTTALKNVHQYISDHSRESSNRLEEEAKRIINRHYYPPISKFDVNVGYSDALAKKLFYLDLPESQQILIYSPLLQKPVNLIKLGSAKTQKLAPCQERLLENVDHKDREYVDVLIKADVKGQMRLITSLIACYVPERVAARQIIKEILEDFYTDAITG